MEIQILDSAGKPLDHLTQWDRNREIRVTGLADMDILPDFHFYNRDAYRALVVPGVNADGGLKAQIPNVLLQSADDLSVSVYQRKANGEGQSLLIRNIPIWKSRKPQDYTFTENVEYIRFEDLVKQSEAVLSDLQAKSADAAAAADQAKKTALDVETALENGAFNGPEGPAGPAGADGFSPVANVTKTTGGAAIRIADKKGVTEVIIANGKDGAPGKDGANGRDGAPGIQGEPGKDAPQIDDSQPGPGNPFSGQHTADLIAAAKEETYIRTVDALAPVFEKTGAIVQGQLVDGYPLHIVQNLDVVQAGSGDPSPENVRPFVPWNGANMVRCGRNLFDQSAQDPKLNFESDASGTIQATPNVSVLLTIPGGVSITASCEGGTALRMGAFREHPKVNQVCDNFVAASAPYKTVTLRTKSDSKFVLIQIRRNVDAITYDDAKKSLMVSVFPGDYAPYQGETFTTTFSDSVYGGKVDWAGKLIDNYCHIKLSDYKSIIEKSNRQNTFLLNFWNLPAEQIVRAVKFGYAYGTMIKPTFRFGTPGAYINTAQQIVLEFANPPFADTLEGFLQYIDDQEAQGTPFELVYERQDPVISTQIVSGSPDVLPGTTTVYADTGDVTVRGRENPAAAIKSQDERIAALEAAIMKPTM